MRLFSLGVLAAVLSAAVLLAGCTKSKTKGEYTEAKTGGQIESEHDEGKHGGHLIHIDDHHKNMAEIVVKDGTITVYFVDHNDTSKAVLLSDQEIVISGLKHDGKDVAITLKAKPLDGETDGSSRFEAAGDAVPEHVKDHEVLHGGKFSYTIGDEKFDVTIPEEDHEDGDEHKTKTKKT